MPPRRPRDRLGSGGDVAGIRAPPTAFFARDAHTKDILGTPLVAVHMTKLGMSLMLVAALLFAGCATTDETATPGDGAPAEGGDLAPMERPKLAFTATQQGEGPQTTYGFEGPSSTSAGWNEVTLSSAVFEPHQVLFLKLDEGRTYEEFEADMAKAAMDPNATAPSYFEELGGVGVVTYMQSATAILELEPGEYAIVCNIPGPAGPHVHHGMLKKFTVGPAVGKTSPPEADITFSMMEYGYQTDEPLTPGQKVIAFKNDGTQVHEAPLIKLQGNATIQEFLEALEAGQGPPPGEGVGGIVNVEPGRTVYALVDLEEGNYGTFCFVPDSGNGAPHLAHGMVTQFSVAAA